MKLKSTPKALNVLVIPAVSNLQKNDKTMNVSRDDNGDIKLDSEDHSISFFCWNRQITNGRKH